MPTEIEKKIEKYRIEIDLIDEEVVRLLNKRAGLANQIGKIKKKYQLPVYVPNREEEVIDHVKKVNPGPLHAEAIQRLFERIIDESRRLERESSSAKHNE